MKLATCAALSMLAIGCAAEPPDATTSSEAALSNPQETAFNFFVSKGLTKIQAAGIVGNLIQESSVNPAAVEPGGPGRGIAQWSVGGRWDTSHDDNATWYASVNGESRAALTTQLGFIWYELDTVGGFGLSNLRAATTISAATIAFENDYEICGDCDQTNRIDYAESVLANYSDGPNSGEGCYSATLGKTMPANACVQSKSDSDWYQCAGGDWVDRWSDPDACNGVYPL
jgi:hypothetical protein